MKTLLTLQAGLHLPKTGKERIEEIIEFIPRRREREGPPIEQFHTQIPLQLQDLSTHRRLLDAVGHFPDGRRDPLVFGNEVEQLKMVDVHSVPMGSTFDHQFNQYFRDFDWIARLPNSPSFMTLRSPPI